MKSETNLIATLFERAEAYSKTSFELLKLKSLDKTADLTSKLVSRLLILIVFSIFTFSLNIAIALWIGDHLGKSYYGFLIVALFYGLFGMVLFLIRHLIKARVNNSIITQVLN